MKKLTVLLMIMFAHHSINSQTWDEWFQQDKTQKKYLVDQISALQSYMDYAKQGYDIAQKGLHTIETIKSGDFSLHQDYFNGLQQVNPAISQWSIVADIIALQWIMVKQVRISLNRMNRNSSFQADEMQYVRNVLEKVVQRGAEQIEQLELLVGSDHYRLKDDERMSRIEGIFREMQSITAFVKEFTSGNEILDVIRKKERDESIRSRELYGVN